MPLPSHEVLLDIHESIQKWKKANKGAKKSNFENCKNYLDRAWDVVKEGAHGVAEESANFIGDQFAERSFEAAGVAAEGAALRVAGVAVLGVGMITLAPLSKALSPWIKAYEISEMAEGIFGLYDLLELAKKSGGSRNQFQCHCGKCAKNLEYIIDKGEWRVFHMAMSVATLGVWWGAKKAHSAIKSTQPTSKKGQVSKALVEAAEAGCSVATVAIFLRVVDKMSDKKRKQSKAKILATVAAIICSEDGWEEFKELW